MIVTITLNPSVDRSFLVPVLYDHSVNTAIRSTTEAGGKGINVSKAVKALGGDTIVLGFVAGKNGRMIKDGLNARGIDHNLVEVQGENRLNIKIYEEDGKHTDIVDHGFSVSDSSFDTLLERVKAYLKSGNIFVVSGLTPPDLPNERYLELCKLITDAGLPLIVDASLEQALVACQAHPSFVKTGARALADAVGIPMTDRQFGHKGAHMLMDAGAQGVALALGTYGAVYARDNVKYYADGPEIKMQYPSGAGDAFIAALAIAMEQKMSDESTIKYALATALASTLVDVSGVASRRDVLKLYEQIKLSTFNKPALDDPKK